MPINDESLRPEIAEREMPSSPEKPVDYDYENAASTLERRAFDILEKLINGIDLLPEYAAKGQRLLVKARKDIEEETKEFFRQLQDALDIAQPNHRPNKNALPIDLTLEEVVKPRAGDGIRNALNSNIGTNYARAEQGYMFNDVKEMYIKAQEAYQSGDEARGDTLMKNAGGMAEIITLILKTGFDDSTQLEYSRKHAEDILDIVRIEMQEDAQINPSERFSKN